MFESTGKLNDDTMNEMKNHLVSFVYKLYIAILLIWFTILGLVGLLVDKIIPITFFLIAIVIGVSSYFLKDSIKKRTMKQIEQTVGKRELNFKLSFEEEGVMVKTLEIKSEVYYKYEIIRRAVETNNFYGFITKSNQLFVISKDSFENKENEEFKIFIKGKCRNVKFES